MMVLAVRLPHIRLTMSEVLDLCGDQLGMVSLCQADKLIRHRPGCDKQRVYVCSSTKLQEVEFVARAKMPLQDVGDSGESHAYDGLCHVFPYVVNSLNLTLTECAIMILLLSGLGYVLRSYSSALKTVGCAV